MRRRRREQGFQGAIRFSLLKVKSRHSSDPTALKAADEPAGEGIEAEVVDLRTLKPLDTETIPRSVRKTGRALVAHEGPNAGGVGMEIAAVIADGAIDTLDGPVVRVAAPASGALPRNGHERRPLQGPWLSTVTVTAIASPRTQFD